MRRAQVAAKQKNWSAAIELATELLDFDPNWKEIHEAHYVLGRSHAGLGQFTKSRTAFQNVLDSEPATGTETAAMAQWMIGESHFPSGRIRRSHRRVPANRNLTCLPAMASSCVTSNRKMFRAAETGQPRDRELPTHPARPQQNDVYGRSR